MTSKLVTLRALSPLHCGTGQGIGGIDLPIARERPTGLPVVPGSSLKGVLRATAPTDVALHLAAFGPDTENAADFAGAVQFSDLNLVCLPMRSLRGTFAYVTSPYTLRRLLRDTADVGLHEGLRVPAAPKTAQGAFVTGEALTIAKKRVVLEDLDFQVEISQGLKTFAETLAVWFFADKEDQAYFAERLCLVHDDVMGVLCEIGTEVLERNRLDPETHTVQKGALWSEEALPVESLLAGMLVATPVQHKNGSVPASAMQLLDHVAGLASHPVQIGGKASVGRGFCQLRVQG